jgi:transposase
MVDDQRRLVRQFTVTADLAGLKQLGETLGGLGPVGGIALESTRDLLVLYLTGQGFTVYPVNPKLSKNWRAGASVCEAKSDARDGRMLACELARRHESLRAWQPQTPPDAELLGLCERRRSLVQERTALVQRLQDMLRQYYPAALAFFHDWTSPAAWQFLNAFPTPQALAAARKATLVRFLKAHRIGLKPVWLERIEQRGETTAWPTPPDALGTQIMAQACAQQLLALEPIIRQLEHLIDQRLPQAPHAPLIRSLPGAGHHLAAELCALVNSVAVRHGGYEAARCLSGVAPVECHSGKRRQVRMRRRCNKSSRNTLHLFAACSTRACPWARAYYQLCRERGDEYGTALRKLADKWWKIILAMIRAGQPYDDPRYVQALAKHHSPIIEKLSRCSGG